jgi:MtrB/PioB family decaheme-associated outer membrane protein
MNRPTTVPAESPPARMRPLALALLLGFVPIGAHADDASNVDALTQIRNFIEFGIGWVDGGSARFGRYNGLDRDGGYGVLNIDWHARAAHDAEVATFTRLQARDLGLDTRRVDLAHGQQGRWVLRAGYAELPMRRSDDARTIFRGAGGNALTLPGDWVRAQNTAGMSQLGASLQPIAIGHERRRGMLGFDLLLARGWQFDSQVRHERKEGIKTIGAVIGNSGGNPRAVILPEPIDYTTREVELALRHFTPARQVEIRYLVSLFDEGQGALSWQNPYATIGGWQASVGHPTGFGQMALPPDNQFHQLSLLAGFNFAHGLRLVGDVAVGRMEQNETFLPYTINPVLAASIVQPLPRSSLDGRIDTTVANLRLTGRGFERIDWSLSGRIDDRDNRTPRDEYVYIAGDSALQNVAANSSFRRFNEPASYRDSRLRADAGWRVKPRTRLTASLEQRETERTYSERERADETTFKLGFRHAAGERVALALRVERADRDGSTYHGNEPFLSGYAPGYTSNVAGQWENPPLLRKSHLADRVRERAGASLTLTPNEAWQIGFDVQRVDDDYRRSELGLTDASSDIYTIDIGWVPSLRWSVYAFASDERLAMRQTGASIRTATREADALDPARRWRAAHDDRIDTHGAGVTFKPSSGRLQLGFDWVDARSVTDIDVSVGSALTARALPSNRTRLKSASLRADYAMAPKWTLTLRLMHEHYRSSDFTIDGVGPAQLANIVLLGETSPEYDANVAIASVTYRF